MLNTDLYLYPGEQIRTPSVALMFWSGDRMNGHNRFRRLVLAHHSRKVTAAPSTRFAAPSTTATRSPAANIRA